MNMSVTNSGNWLQNMRILDLNSDQGIVICVFDRY